VREHICGDGDRGKTRMSDTTFWEPTMGAIECVIDCLPRKAQERIVERLQLLARVQESHGELVASRPD
jgi:hypothetical protein